MHLFTVICLPPCFAKASPCKTLCLSNHIQYISTSLRHTKPTDEWCATNRISEVGWSPLTGTKSISLSNTSCVNVFTNMTTVLKPWDLASFTLVFHNLRTVLLNRKVIWILDPSETKDSVPVHPGNCICFGVTVCYFHDTDVAHIWRNLFSPEVFGHRLPSSGKETASKNWVYGHWSKETAITQDPNCSAHMPFYGRTNACNSWALFEEPCLTCLLKKLGKKYWMQMRIICRGRKEHFMDFLLAKGS